VRADRAAASRMLVCFTGLLSACVERPPEQSDSAATTAAVAADSVTFPGRVVAELSALRQGVTPAQWLRNHPGDSLSPFTITEGNEKTGLWCVRASRRDSLADGSAIVRNAYFYPPSPPEPLELPPDGDAREIVARSCILGVVWVETPHSDSVGGRQLAERTRETLTREYGKVTADTDFFARLPITDSQKNVLKTDPKYETHRLGISFFGSAYWRAPGRWKRGSVTVVSAFDAGSRSVSHPRVLAFAHLPNAQLEREESIDESTPELDEALITAGRLTQLDSIVVRNFLALRGEEAEEPERIAALGRWLATAGNLKSGQHAAALFVADGVVPERLDEDDSVTSRAYANLGLKFVRSELAGSNNYTHGLLEEALRLDPNGPIGQLATIELLDRGFDLTGMCGGGGFDQVIKVGEPFVSRLTTSRAKARVLFLLGDAYADIVALAAGAGQDYVDTLDFSARAPSARRKAIAYYRQGLALDRVSTKAGAAWLEGWRLLAGLPPSRTHFFCVYD
jgi:hypothetical protein